ncbi:MAG: extracellular solute-binding protein [Bradyrhizobium sp.]|nr:extracellular solute-binding protein [Bradyrhizobium sp.]
MALSLSVHGFAATASESSAIAMHGSPALPADFQHLPYVNPQAPKGGRLVWGLLGTFDSLNPFIVRGVAVQQIRTHVFESLLTRGNDEPFTLYGLLARTVETDDERTYVTFRLDPRARFSDGQPVLADDVSFSWNLLREHGRPNHRQFYGKVAKVEVLDPLTIRFDFGGVADRELPLILGLMPILPKHATDVATFEDTSMAAPVGSGPYRVTAVRPGASVTLTRNPDYWGRDLPINRGLWNFDEIRLDYYREANGQFEAFKRGLYDVRVENEPLRWHDGYDFPAARDGEIIRDSVTSGMPQPSQFLVFNTRRPVFADIKVRRALTLLFDFEWINRNYFFGLYRRSGGYFAGSELSAYGRAADATERELLKPFTARIPPDIMDGSYRLPVTDGSGRDRTALKAALDRYTARREAWMEEVLSAPTAREVTARMLMGVAEKQTDPSNPPGCLLVQGGLACGSGSANVPFELAARRAQTEEQLRHRFERAKAEGDLAEAADPAALARYVSAVITGMSVMASSGADREALAQVAEVAIRSVEEQSVRAPIAAN